MICDHLYSSTMPTLKNTWVNKHLIVFRTSVFESLVCLFKIPSCTFYSTQKTRILQFIYLYTSLWTDERKGNSFFHSLLKTVLYVAAPGHFVTFFQVLPSLLCSLTFSLEIKKRQPSKAKTKAGGNVTL